MKDNPARYGLAFDDAPVLNICIGDKSNKNNDMGYYRPVSEFNIGKKAEHYDRKFYTEKEIIKHT